jgi:uncharacterized protein (TIGR03083 family)
MSTRELLHSNDVRLHGVAAALTDHDWSAPSLCEEWTNHEVLAHLVIGYGSGLGIVMSGMWRHRGSFDDANAEMSRTLAARRSPAALLDDFAGFVHRPTGMGRYFPGRLLLGDHVTHELDILLALDRAPTISPEALIAVLNTQVSLPNPFVPAYRNSRGLQIHAADVGWTHGARGPEVHGSAADLVSVLGNRPNALHRLRGDGVSVLAERVVSRPTRRAG